MRDGNADFPDMAGIYSSPGECRGPALYPPQCWARFASALRPTLPNLRHHPRRHPGMGSAGIQFLTQTKQQTDPWIPA
jgi:hypothetical protein